MYRRENCDQLSGKDFCLALSGVFCGDTIWNGSGTLDHHITTHSRFLDKDFIEYVGEDPHKYRSRPKVSHYPRNPDYHSATITDNAAREDAQSIPE